MEIKDTRYNTIKYYVKYLNVNKIPYMPNVVEIGPFVFSPVESWHVKT